MNIIPLVLFVFAFVLFILAGLGIPSSRYSLIGFGLACLTAGFFFQGAVSP